MSRPLNHIYDNPRTAFFQQFVPSGESKADWACATGVQVKLVNPSKLVRGMLELTGLTSVLHVSSVDDVIEMFCPSHHAIENLDLAVA